MGCVVKIFGKRRNEILDWHKLKILNINNPLGKRAAESNSSTFRYNQILERYLVGRDDDSRIQGTTREFSYARATDETCQTI